MKTTEGKLQRILELPELYKLGIFLVTVCGLGSLLWFVLVGPELEKTKELKSAIEGSTGLRASLAKEELIAKNLDVYRKEVVELEVELKKALAELPDKREIDALLAQISNVGRDAGLEMRVFKPREEDKLDYYASVPVEMEVTGTYHQIASFFDEVGHMNRIVNLHDFTMTGDRSGKKSRDEEQMTSVRASVIATTFRFLEESERVSASPATAPAAKTEVKKQPAAGH
ncbi:type 4a pilus biogenesis protein PilO [bacterium]|nr:type 4a pilus biogenesis protein PilO [bacterium]